MTDADKKPAHNLWIELTTRIATQRLPFRSGDEESAVSSIHNLFPAARKLMTENPDAREFIALADRMLNDVIRPYTARWHQWLTTSATERNAEGKPALKFIDEWVRKQFRRELRELQPKLLGFAKALEAMKDGKELNPKWTSLLPADVDALRKEMIEHAEARLGMSIDAGSRDQVRFGSMTEDVRKKLANDINNAEHDEVRRKRGDAPDGAVVNARALAFSGGGIRSATFCLGITQVLAYAFGRQIQGAV
ncbi:MAG: hypothetical protein ABL962_16205 [Fimbriimonadaceae bacterium]